MPEEPKKEEEEVPPEEEPKKEPEAEPEEEESPPEEKKEGFSFESEQDFMEKTAKVMGSVLDERARAKREAKQRKVEEKEGGLSDKIFPEGYSAPNWEDPSRKIIDRAKAEIRREDAERHRKATERLESISQEFDNQIAQIRKDNPNLPAQGTEKGNEFERELAEIGAKYKGITNMHDAYEIWGVKQTKKSRPSSRQRETASKVGRPTGGPTPTKKRPYAKVAGRSLDEAEDAAVKRFKELS
jgi:hypothetical protein